LLDLDIDKLTSFNSIFKEEAKTDKDERTELGEKVVNLFRPVSV